MSYDNILLKRAKKEFFGALNWYDDKQPGLGDRFRAEVYKRINMISLHPERYVQQHPPYRETGIAVFPYLIIYKINEKKKLVVVTSIFHTSRNPKKKYR